MITNNKLAPIKLVLNDIFYTLKEDSRFNTFGENKVIIILAFLNKGEFYLHHNVFINSEIIFEN
jgi:hypothetical protein